MTPSVVTLQPVPPQEPPQVGAPLLAALNRDDAVATAAWQRWRGSVDIQHLTWPEMQLLPVLHGPRLDEWLTGDPAAGIIKGIVRRAWSEAQVRLGLVREIVGSLQRSGCTPVTVIGAAGAYLRCLGAAAIRPILEVRILMPRWHLPLTTAVLEGEGWQLRDRYPEGDLLERRSHVLFERNGSRLYLHWRVLEVDARLAASCERAFLARHDTAAAIGSEFRILPAAEALIESICGHSESVDVLAWQADAAFIVSSTSARIDWPRLLRIARQFSPSIIRRVAQLRALGLEIPEPSAMEPPPGRLALVLAAVLGRA